MKVICRTLSLLAVCSVTAVAQKSQPVEIGFDAALTSLKYDFSQNTPGGVRQRASATTTLVEFPIQSVRVGFPVNDKVAIEPSLGFLHGSTNGNSGSEYDARIA